MNEKRHNTCLLVLRNPRSPKSEQELRLAAMRIITQFDFSFKSSNMRNEWVKVIEGCSARHSLITQLNFSFKLKFYS